MKPRPGQDVITLTARWLGRFCGRRGTDGQPVADGCDFHWEATTGAAPERYCRRFSPPISDAFPDPIPLDWFPRSSLRSLRCEECVETYGGVEDE